MATNSTEGGKLMNWGEFYWIILTISDLFVLLHIPWKMLMLAAFLLCITYKAFLVVSFTHTTHNLLYAVLVFYGSIDPHTLDYATGTRVNSTNEATLKNMTKHSTWIQQESCYSPNNNETVWYAIGLCVFCQRRNVKHNGTGCTPVASFVILTLLWK